MSSIRLNCALTLKIEEIINHWSKISINLVQLEHCSCRNMYVHLNFLYLFSSNVYSSI